MLKNISGQKLELFVFDTTNGAPKTGDAANLTAYLDKDHAGALTALGDTSATEIDSTNAKGWYRFDLTQAETNFDEGLFTGKSSTANVSVVGRVVQTVPSGWDTLIQKLVGMIETGDGSPTYDRFKATAIERGNIDFISRDAGAADALEAMLDGTGANVTISHLNIYDGAEINGGPSQSDALRIIADTGGGVGVLIEGKGSDNGLTIQSGASGGIAAVFAGAGGAIFAEATAGDAVAFVSSGNDGDALSLIADGIGAAINATGGSNGPGISVIAGNNSNGLSIQGGGNGHGLRIFGGGTSGHGIFVDATNGAAIKATGAGSGNAGVDFTGGTNAAGLKVNGNGSGAGFESNAGGTGVDVDADVINRLRSMIEYGPGSPTNSYSRFHTQALETAPAAPTAGVVADAVWDEARAGHTIAGSFGEWGYRLMNMIEVGVGSPTYDRFIGTALETAPSGGSAPTAGQVADAVWDELRADHIVSGSFGEYGYRMASLIEVGVGSPTYYRLNSLAIEIVTALLPTGLSAAGNMKSDVEEVNESTAAVTRMKRALESEVLVTCDSGSSTTSIVASSISPASAVNDQFNGRIILFDLNTATAALRGQGTRITDYVHGTLTFTVDALTTAPASGDTFVIV